MVRRPEELKPLGWREWISLPSLGVPAIKVKVDTGARSSALHAFDVEHFTRDGAAWVRFTVHPFQDDDRTVIRAECLLLGQRVVRSSAGHQETRPVVAASVRIGDVSFDTDVTLTNRDSMGFRMLLGRQAIRGRFVVDPGRSFVQPRPSGAPDAPVSATPAAESSPAPVPRSPA